MLTTDLLTQLMRQLQTEYNPPFTDTPCEDVYSIVYHIDIFEIGSAMEINRHIDIDFIYGEYYEFHEGENIYHLIYDICDLNKINNGVEQEFILYQKQMRT